MSGVAGFVCIIKLACLCPLRLKRTVTFGKNMTFLGQHDPDAAPDSAMLAVSLCALALSGSSISALRAPVTARAAPAVATTAAPAQSEENGVDEKYPYRFDGRLWFNPSLVRCDTVAPPSAGVQFISLFGWTLGGTVCLQYDESPVGPYVEYVTMGALVAKRGAIGQWGSRLFVSTQPAEEVCRRVWDVPAEVADIAFDDAGDGWGLSVASPPARVAGSQTETIRVRGWANTRSGGTADEAVGGLPVLWTPSIKALWAPIRVPLPFGDGDAKLPLHDLRLSVASARVHLTGQRPSDALGVPLPIGLSVDGLRIEIAREGEKPL